MPKTHKHSITSIPDPLFEWSTICNVKQKTLCMFILFSLSILKIVRDSITSVSEFYFQNRTFSIKPEM